jgi:DNA-binding transcriptional MerR regulator
MDAHRPARRSNWLFGAHAPVYEQIGLLPAPHRTPAGYRSYDQDAVTRSRFVRAAQILGLSLAEIAEVLRIRDYQGPPCSYVAELHGTHVSDLETRIKDLTALRDELRARRPFAAEPDPARCRSDQVCYLIEPDLLEGDVSEK